MPKVSAGQVKRELEKLVESHPDDNDLVRSVRYISKYLKPAKGGRPTRWDTIALLHLRYVVAFYELQGSKPVDVYKHVLGEFSESSLVIESRTDPEGRSTSKRIRDLDGEAKRLISSDEEAKKYWKFFQGALTSRAAKLKTILPGKSVRARRPMTIQQVREKLSGR